jgi:hypothetical protein
MSKRDVKTAKLELELEVDVESQGKKPKIESKTRDSETQTIRNQEDYVYILRIQPWDCWCGPSDTCKQCGRNAVDSCEVTWVKGNHDHYEAGMPTEYCSEMCYPCVNKLIKKESLAGFLKSQGWYYKYGFISHPTQSQLEM